MNCRKPNEKLQRYVIIFLWEVIYVRFYNWDWPLDLVLVLYDLIELIIKASLYTKDYSTFDIHTQHTCLMFNKCLIHLFDCTWLNVLYVCSTTCLIKLKRFLIILYVFGSDFCHPLCLCLVLTLFFIVLNMFCVEKKKRCQSFFTTHSRVTKLEKCIFFTFFGSLAERFATH